MILKIKKLNPKAIIPKRGHKGDAGMDFHSLEEHTIEPGKRKMFGTGIAMEVPEGYAILVWEKSGLASKHGIKTMAGVGDCHYRGEYKVILLNTSNKAYTVKKGDKIAQFLVQRVEYPKIQEVSELSKTSRGESGFGSTGK